MIYFNPRSLSTDCGKNSCDFDALTAVILRDADEANI